MENIFKLSAELHCVLDRKSAIKNISPTFARLLKVRESSTLKGLYLAEKLIEEDQTKFKKILETTPLKTITPIRFKVLVKENQVTKITGKIYKETEEKIYFTGIPNLAQDSPLARFKRFFDLELLDVMLVTDGRGRMILPNRGFQEIFGHSREELKKFTVLQFVHPEDRAFLIHFIKEIKREEGLLRKTLLRMFDKNQSIRWMSWRLVYVRGSIYAVANDITAIEEQKIKIQSLLDRQLKQNEILVKSREDLKETLGTLKMRNFELDQFVYRTSHDLRSPLTSILGLVNLAQLDQDNPERLMDYIDRIKKSTLKLDDFIHSLIDYSKSGRSEIIPVAIHFNKVFNVCKQELEYLEGFRTLNFELEIIGKEVFKSDYLRVQTIFTNILSNAVKYQKKYIEDSFLKVTIDVSSSKKAMIVFQDNGIGIEEKLINSIFDMFYRATEEAVGSGLGLYIVKQTVEKLEGQIFVESQIGKGTTFTLLLPNLEGKFLKNRDLLDIRNYS